jgi:predicted phosphodiesterase
MKPSNVSGVVLDIDWERMIDIILPQVKVNRTVSYNDIEVEQREDTYGEMMFFGDIHAGSRNVSINPLNSHLKFVQDHPNIRVGLMGDLVEYATNTNFVKEECLDPDEQIDFIVKKFKPIRNRIDFMLWGNHEERYSKYTKSNRFLSSLAREIGVSDHCYIGEPQRGVFCAVHSNDRLYGMYAQHGSTASFADKFSQQKKAAKSNNVSLIVQGHTHQLGFDQQTIKGMEMLENEVAKVTKRVMLVATGCFVKEPGYAEAKSYPYTVVGAPIVRFYSSRDKLDYTDLTQEYRDYITKGGIVFGETKGVLNWGGLLPKNYESEETKTLKYNKAIDILSRKNP